MPDPLPPPHTGEARLRSGEDLISGLPDELLHGILVRLRSARAAARTGVLSRRWRHVWHHMPELHLDLRTEAVPPASFLDAVDGALAACLAPTLDRLSISLSAGGNHHLAVPPRRAAPWLRFAAERVAGELGLFVPPHSAPPLPGRRAELEVPACGRAKRITLSPQEGWRLRLPPDGLFAALTVLRIHCGLMEGSEVSTLVCTRCPRLTELEISVVLVAVSDISIRSHSLRSLWFRAISTNRLEIVAPRLENLTLGSYDCIQTDVSAPNLAKLIWNDGGYNPGSHQFHDVGRHLRLLEIRLNFATAALMWKFDEVDVLELGIRVGKGVADYQSFLNETKTMPKCKTLHISEYWNCHGVAPVMLRLLKSCNGIRKFSLTLDYLNGSLTHPCPSSCPCRLEGSHRIDDIDLSLLDEVEISFSGLPLIEVELEFFETLSKCNATGFKRLVLNYKRPTTPETKEVSDKVRGMFGSNVEVEFYVFPDGPYGRRERFD